MCFPRGRSSVASPACVSSFTLDMMELDAVGERGDAAITFGPGGRGHAGNENGSSMALLKLQVVHMAVSAWFAG